MNILITPIRDVKSRFTERAGNTIIKCLDMVSEPGTLFMEMLLRSSANYTELMELATSQNYKLIKFNLGNFQAES